MVLEFSGPRWKKEKILKLKICVCISVYFKWECKEEARRCGWSHRRESGWGGWRVLGRCEGEFDRR